MRVRRARTSILSEMNGRVVTIDVVHMRNIHSTLCVVRCVFSGKKRLNEIAPIFFCYIPIFQDFDNLFIFDFGPSGINSHYFSHLFSLFRLKNIELYAMWRRVPWNPDVENWLVWHVHEPRFNYLQVDDGLMLKLRRMSHKQHVWSILGFFRFWICVWRFDIDFRSEPAARAQNFRSLWDFLCVSDETLIKDALSE